MLEKKRYLLRPIHDEALKLGKMAFISGPRQVGKTTLAHHLAGQYASQVYYNWDDIEFRRLWVLSPSRLTQPLAEGGCLIFDEIHKAKNWKGTLKGIYDLNQRKNPIIVTGSARLETFRRGGDSLLGRYFHFRLHPYSLGELQNPGIKTPEDLANFLQSPVATTAPSSIHLNDEIMKFGGFPEPFQAQKERHYRMWSQARLEDLVREDLRDLSRVMDLSRLELLAALLPERVGSLLSKKNLSEDMEVSQPTIKNWLSLLEKVFLHYVVTPFSKKMARSLKKESKIYLWDWAQNKNKGQLIENYVASTLSKAVDFWTQFGYGKYDLHFFRDKEKKEVDFVITCDQFPVYLIEVKSSDKNPMKNLRYLRHQWPQAQALQLIAEPNYYRFHQQEKIHVMSMVNFLEKLP